MKQNILNWEKQIADITRQFTEAFGSISRDALNWKPDPKSWSVAQNINHLITVNQTYFPIIEQIRSGTYQVPFTGRYAFITQFFGNFILKAVAPENRKKTKTFPIWEPAASDFDTPIIGKFVDHQQQLIALIKESGDLLEKNVVISSPANKFIVYPLEKAFDIIVAHERRHLLQAQEILLHIPKASANKN